MTQKTSFIADYSNGEHCEDGRYYAVIDATRLYTDQSLHANRFITATRKEPVYVWQPRSGDTIPISGREPVTANGNEVVFLKKLDSDGTQLKIYIPSGSHGPLDESVLDEKYQEGFEYVPKYPKEDPILKILPEGASVKVRVPKNVPIPVLHEVVDRPAVILNARGVGKHQFLEVGDSLKFEDGECLPLPKVEIDSAWNLQQRGEARKK